MNSDRALLPSLFHLQSPQVSMSNPASASRSLSKNWVLAVRRTAHQEVRPPFSEQMRQHGGRGFVRAAILGQTPRHWFIATAAAFLLIIGCHSALALDLIGRPAPSFVLKDRDGKTCALADFQGKPVLLFFGDESEQSQKGFSELAGIADHYLGSELNIIALALNKNAAQAAEYQEALWLTYPLYGNADSKLAEAFGVRQGAQAVFLDSKHVIRHAAPYYDQASLKKVLFQLMEEKVFVVTARQFEYEPNIITVNKGDKVLIKLLAEDVVHGIYIDGYELFINQYLDREGQLVPPEKAGHHIKPGELGLVKFVADKTGRFSMRCAATCAAFHPYMYGWLKVKPNSRFYSGIILALLLGGLSLFYFSKEKNQGRILGIISSQWRFELTRYPIVRKILKSRWIPFLGIVLNIFFFTVILFACFVGGVSAGNYNFGIMFVWIVWFALLMMVMVPFFSRIWCAVCPLPFLGDWFQRLSFLAVREKSAGMNKNWPKRLRNMWLVNFLFMGITFGNGYFTTRPIASFVMFAIIIFAATVIALIYRKRTFCLYLCPVGGFQGLYSNMATLEIRPKDKDKCESHPLKPCFVGSKNGYGCPWLQHPYNLKRNTYCGLCLECFKSCPKDNMAINLRPPGVDLLVDEKKGIDESWKAFLMIGCAIIFYTFMMGPWGFLKDWQNAKTFFGLLKYIAFSSVLSLLILPAIYSIFVFLSRRVSKTEVSYKKMFVNYSYALVPLGLLAWVAFSFGFLLPNGSYVIAVISDPFAWGWNLFGTADFPWTPFLTYWMPYLQIISLIFGLIFSIDIVVKISRQMFSSKKEAMMSCIPIVICLITLTLALEWLFVGG